MHRAEFADDVIPAVLLQRREEGVLQAVHQLLHLRKEAAVMDDVYFSLRKHENLGGRHASRISTARNTASFDGASRGCRVIASITHAALSVPEQPEDTPGSRFAPRDAHCARAQLETAFPFENKEKTGTDCKMESLRPFLAKLCFMCTKGQTFGT